MSRAMTRAVAAPVARLTPMAWLLDMLEVLDCGAREWGGGLQ